MPAQSLGCAHGGRVCVCSTSADLFTRVRKFQDDMPAQSFGGAHRGRVCVCAFIGVSVCACI